LKRLRTDPGGQKNGRTLPSEWCIPQDYQGLVSRTFEAEDVIEDPLVRHPMHAFGFLRQRAGFAGHNVRRGPARSGKAAPRFARSTG
jgi:hypothetical protein